MVDFIHKATKLHNNKYSYEYTTFSNNQYDKVEIECPIHGKFKQSIYYHLKGFGCKKCGIESCRNKNKNKLSEVIEKSNIIHSHKYDYSLITEYNNNKTKYDIICKEHGVFNQSFDKHITSKQGCPKCKKNYKNTLSDFIENGKKIHGDIYDYSNITEYINSKFKYDIICKKHGIFKQCYNKHIIHEHGCPKCKDSKGVKKIKKILDILELKYETEKTFKGCKNKNLLRFDIYIPQLNLCIEYDGIQHFKPTNFSNKMSYEKTIVEFDKLLINDKIKNDFCFINKINIIRISYKEYKNLEDILLDKIKKNYEIH